MTGDGSITMEEFEHLAKDGVLLHGTLQQYSDAFEAVDNDHDGELSIILNYVYISPLTLGD
jgi:Ca2+-binding EF-hand superfamily protein